MPDSSGNAVVPRQSELPESEALFRPEVLAETQARWMGTVLLAPNISGAILSACALAAATAIVALLVFGQYTRKARINGWLVPQQGVVRIFAPMPAVITELHVHEGMEVRKGTPLVELSTELQSEAVGATRAAIVRRLKSRRESLLAERDVHAQLSSRRAAELSDRVGALRTEQEHLQAEAEIQRARVKLAQEAENRQRVLLQHGDASLRQMQEAQQQRLDQELSLRALERNQSEIRRELLELEGQLATLPMNVEIERADIDRQVASLEQEIAEAEAQRQIVISAPQSGTVTGIQAELGSNVGTAVPLLSIVPSGVKLEAQLFSPSRAIGFVRPGQHVLLRYQAFPYQKFGQYEGVVADVSRTATSPSDLSQQLAGLTSLFDANEPVYRITVALESQTATAYGKPVPLQPGMQLEADVLMEQRRLIEWVFDPLFSLTGKWQG